MSAPVSRCLFCLVVLLAAVSSVSAGSEDTLILQKSEYCAGCKVTLEHFMRQSLEAIRTSANEQEQALDLEPIISSLCLDDYFHAFVPGVTYACMKIVDEHKSALLKYNEFDNVDDQRTALMLTKSNFYKASKSVCLDTAKACPKYMYPKKPVSQKDRTMCKACEAVGESLEAMKAVRLLQTSREVVENACESLGFSHQPSAWMEDYCEEIVEDHEGAMIDLLNHFDFDSRVQITTQLCEGILGCSADGKSDL